MAFTDVLKFKLISKSQRYKHVYKMIYNGRETWYARIRRPNWSNVFETERLAAIAVDKKLIEMKRKPVNILKPTLKNKNT